MIARECHGGPSVKRLSVAFWRLRGILPMLAATLFLSSVENNPVVARSKSMAIKNYAATISFEFFEHFLEVAMVGNQGSITGFGGRSLVPDSLETKETKTP